MKQIILNTGAMTLVSDEDFQILCGESWSVSSKGYIRRGQRVNGKRVTIYMHVVIARRMGIVGMVDHEDRNPFNNQRENLRLASYSQNAMNRETDNTSGYKGVSYQKRDGKWLAQIMKDGIHYHLGLHLTPEAAALAYNAKAIELFKEFAALNAVSI